MIFPLEASIPSAQSLSDALKSTKADAAFVVPSIIEEMSKSMDLLDHISAKLDTLVYSGGDLPTRYGDVVASKIPIINFYGTTETASVGIIRQVGEISRTDWKYLRIHPDAGVELRHYAGDMYELCMVRQPALEGHQQVFKIFPDLQEYRSRDLFVRHPSESKRDMWSHCGRADDIVVFSNGEKINPIGVEQHIFSSHPEISGVLVAGSQRFQAALLVELSSVEETSPLHRSGIIEKIWPTVEQANKSAPAHGQVAKSHILFTDPQRPMVRTSKGTIQRLATLAQYTKELDDLYSKADSAPGSPTKACIDIQNTDSLLLYLIDAVSSVTGRVFSKEDNFFMEGMDSLQALQLTRRLKHALAIPELAPSTIYANPSIVSLAAALQRMSGEKQMSKSLDSQNRVHTIDAMLSEYKALVDQIYVPFHPTPLTGRLSMLVKGPPNVVMLSGSTGALGSYILQVLLSTTTAHIICLNRAPDSASLQKQRNLTRGLTTDFPTGRVTFLAADFSEPNLGLDASVYSNLLEQVTSIIHNAWPVNFNLSLDSFRPQITGVVNLIKFAVASWLSPSLLYVSSISSVSNHGGPFIPEEVLHDNTAPLPMGYAESKYLSERILDHANEFLPLRASVARVGQIAGPIQGSGHWNSSEWLPSLIISSLHVGVVPRSLGCNLDRIDWVPIDFLARVLVELVDAGDAQSSEPSPSRATVFNILNPHPVQWETLLPTISNFLSSTNLRNGGKPIETTSFECWINKVREKAEAGSGVEHSENGGFEKMLEVNPAAKLLEFYEDACTAAEGVWDTRKAEEASATLRALEGIKGSWVEKWMGAWVS